MKATEMFRWHAPVPKTYLKGSKIFCINGHCCAVVTEDVNENQHIEDILAALRVVPPQNFIAEGLPDPVCKLCGGDVIYGFPRTIH